MLAQDSLHEFLQPCLPSTMRSRSTALHRPAQLATMRHERHSQDADNPIVSINHGQLANLIKGSESKALLAEPSERSNNAGQGRRRGGGSKGRGSQGAKAGGRAEAHTHRACSFTILSLSFRACSRACFPRARACILITLSSSAARSSRSALPGRALARQITSDKGGKGGWNVMH